MKNKHSFFAFFVLIALAIFVVTGVVFGAWQGPSSDPPGGNVSAPLHTGSAGQSKAGGLVLNTGGAANGLIVSQGNVGIGASSPSYKLDVVSGGASTARFGTGSSDTVVIGGGLGKLTVGTIDPVYDIGGEKFATYIAAMTGTKEETTGKTKIICNAGNVCASVIDFNKTKKGSDLWLFYQTTDFGNDWDNLVVLLTPEGNKNHLWYQAKPNKAQLVIYGETEGKVSYRLTAPRFDYQNWTNFNQDENVDGLKVEPK